MNLLIWVFYRPSHPSATDDLRLRPSLELRMKIKVTQIVVEGVESVEVTRGVSNSSAGGRQARHWATET